MRYGFRTAWADGGTVTRAGNLVLARGITDRAHRCHSDPRRRGRRACRMRGVRQQHGIPHASLCRLAKSATEHSPTARRGRYPSLSGCPRNDEHRARAGCAHGPGCSGCCTRDESSDREQLGGQPGSLDLIDPRRSCTVSYQAGQQATTVRISRLFRLFHRRHGGAT